MYIYIIIGVIILLLIYVFATYNSFIKLDNDVKESFATMDVFLKKRWDLIPNLLETVKGYTKHEKDTLKEITNLRKSSYDDMSMDSKISSNEKLNNSLGKLIALAEAYPELKANENYLNMSNQLTKLEDDIANSRKYYNAVVRNFNNKVQMIPSNIIAKIFGFKTVKMFETSEVEKENIKVDLK